ncbi:MAG: hypothetical protein AAF745_15815 [Planctomycetota bacterium]
MAGSTYMIVIARKFGQLGNRLFLFAHLIAAARHYGVELRNPCFAEYADLFPSTRSDLWCRYEVHRQRNDPADSRPSRLARKSLMAATESATNVTARLGLFRRRIEVIRLRSGEYCDLSGDRFQAAIHSGRTLLLQGWEFRGDAFLDQHRSHVCDFFRISDSDQLAVNRCIARARQESDILVGVHIRRGDYARFRGGRFFYTDQQYAMWMRDVQQRYAGQRVGFLVCSHDRIDQTKFRGLTITRGPGTGLRDLYSLAETDWMMGPPSTFTAWAEFYGRKPRIELESSAAEIRIPGEQSVAA